MQNISIAEKQVVLYFLRFANKINEAERNDFFDPRNRDLWTRSFAQFLEEQINPERPSND
jgi:hypothetical protein